MDDWVDPSIWLSFGRHACCLCNALIRSAGDCQLKGLLLGLFPSFSSTHTQSDTPTAQHFWTGRRKTNRFHVLALGNLTTTQSLILITQTPIIWLKQVGFYISSIHHRPPQCHVILHRHQQRVGVLLCRNFFPLFRELLMNFVKFSYSHISKFC